MAITQLNPNATPQEEVKKAQAAAAAAPEQIDKDILGSKSGDLEFVAPLGDPSRDDVTITVDKAGKKTRTVTPTIVGYRLRALKDMEIPDCGADDDLKTNIMSYKDVNGRRKVKKGETFDLTRFEVGLLLSPPEYNGRITGGQREMVCAYTISGAKDSAGKVMASSTTKIPTVSLRALEGSIKDFKMVDVLTYTVEEIASKDKDGNPTTIRRKNRQIVPGFEKWLPLTVTAERKSSGTAAPASPKETRNKSAAAFLAIVSSKAKKAQ